MRERHPYTDDSVVRVLGNGLTVTLERLPYLHSVSVGVWIQTGSANEPEKHAGISHFLEHLFFKGTQSRTARQIVEPIERTGGHLNAFTSREYTCVYAKTLGRHVSTAIEILADIIKHSTFAELEKERNVILEEIASIEDMPEDYAHDLLVARMWPGHPLGRSVSGYERSVSGISIEDVGAYYRQWYHPGNLYVSVAGNFEESAVMGQIEREFGSMTAGGARESGSGPVFSGGLEWVDRDIGQHHVCLGFPGPTVEEERRYVYDVLWSALGGGSTSRLFQRIREDEGLAYSIYAFHSAYLTAGVFGVYSAFAPESYGRTMGLTFEEIRRFRDEGISEQELRDHQEHLKGSMLMSLENPFNRMARMSKSMMYYGRVLPVAEVAAGIDGVTGGDVADLAREIFRRETCTMLVLGPPVADGPAEVLL